MSTDPSDQVAAKEANEVIETAKRCIERGEGKGKCHVFIDKSDTCECGQMDLSKARMR